MSLEGRYVYEAGQTADSAGSALLSRFAIRRIETLDAPPSSLIELRSRGVSFPRGAPQLSQTLRPGRLPYSGPAALAPSSPAVRGSSTAAGNCLSF
ncbi:hypothetical protein Taro_041505 [Colocasia esculenta]|uniref:Uncharacterized protein n=1 Tax=Colocasia esculenta TaxID=4460 RepID=A0A843WEK0_COLES|nr:hypothetical protein [Colocasia esculenta]